MGGIDVEKVLCIVVFLLRYKSHVTSKVRRIHTAQV